MKLIQENGNEKRIFTLIDNGMKIHESSKLGEINRTIPFELISNDFVKLNFNPIQWVILFNHRFTWRDKFNIIYEI